MLELSILKTTAVVNRCSCTTHASILTSPSSSCGALITDSVALLVYTQIFISMVHVGQH
jgi:hypothetical protein